MFFTIFQILNVLAMAETLEQQIQEGEEVGAEETEEKDVFDTSEEDSSEEEEEEEPPMPDIEGLKPFAELSDEEIMELDKETIKKYVTAMPKKMKREFFERVQFNKEFYEQYGDFMIAEGAACGIVMVSYPPIPLRAETTIANITTEVVVEEERLDQEETEEREWVKAAVEEGDDIEIEEVVVGSEDSEDEEIDSEKVRKVWRRMARIKYKEFEAYRDLSQLAKGMTQKELAFGIQHTPRPSAYLPASAEKLFENLGGSEAEFNRAIAVGERSLALYNKHVHGQKPRPVDKIAKDYGVTVARIAEIIHKQTYREKKKEKKEALKKEKESPGKGRTTRSSSIASASSSAQSAGTPEATHETEGEEQPKTKKRRITPTPVTEPQ